MKEEWAPIKGYEGIYEVSTLGNFVKINKDGSKRPLKTTKNNCGYYTIGLWKNGKVKQFRISRDGNIEKINLRYFRIHWNTNILYIATSDFDNRFVHCSCLLYYHRKELHV